MHHEDTDVLLLMAETVDTACLRGIDTAAVDSDRFRACAWRGELTADWDEFRDRHACFFDRFAPHRLLARLALGDDAGDDLDEPRSALRRQCAQARQSAKIAPCIAEEEAMARRVERVDFRGAEGQKLAALLEMPAGPPRAYALFAHCFTCSKDVFAATRIAAGLAERGIAVLRFDFTGLGASEGEFANTNFSSNLADLVAAAEFLRVQHEAPKLLIGHSLGGAAVLASAARVAEAVAVATIGAPADPAHLQNLFGDKVAIIKATGEAEITIAGRSFHIKRQFLEDIARHRLEEAIRHLGKALIVFHAPLDEVVGIDNAAQIFQAARHPKSFVSLDQADHLLRRREDAEYVAEVLAAWASRYLGASQAAVEKALPIPAPSQQGEVVVAETRTGRFTQGVAVGRHRLAADEPESVGGDDAGPGPYDYLLAGLGACTSMTLRLYAERKSLPLERVTVRLFHQKIHAVDCAECETKEGKIDHIDRIIELTGPLDSEQRQRLLEIADKCPVHRTLESEIRIVTKLIEAGEAISPG